VYSIVKSPNSLSVRIRLYSRSTYTFSSSKRRNIGNTNDLSPPIILGVPATCLKSDSFRVAAAFTLLLRPYRNYEKNQSDLQAKTPILQISFHLGGPYQHICPAKRIPESRIDLLIGLFVLHCTNDYWYEIASDFTSASGEMGYIDCQELEISVVVYIHDRLISLTRLFP
jgi:hypothetical protein